MISEDKINKLANEIFNFIGDEQINIALPALVLTLINATKAAGIDPEIVAAFFRQQDDNVATLN